MQPAVNHCRILIGPAKGSAHNALLTSFKAEWEASLVSGADTLEMRQFAEHGMVGTNQPITEAKL